MRVHVVVLDNHVESEIEVVGVFYDIETAQQVVEDLTNEAKHDIDIILESMVVL